MNKKLKQEEPKKLKTLAMFEKIPIEGGEVRRVPNGYNVTEFLPNGAVTTTFVSDGKWERLNAKTLLTDRDILDLAGVGKPWLAAARRNGLKKFGKHTPRKELDRYTTVNTI